MIKILPIQPHQVPAAKQVISAVAQRIFEPDKSPQEFEEILADEHELVDVDDFEQVYCAPHGLFLVVLDDDKVVGTGAIKPLAVEIAELKRLWLLEEYHGQGIGYCVVMRLFEFARQQGYKKIRLQTDTIQIRALSFYKRLGFVEIPSYQYNEYDDVSMEFILQP